MRPRTGMTARPFAPRHDQIALSDESHEAWLTAFGEEIDHVLAHLAALKEQAASAGGQEGADARQEEFLRLRTELAALHEQGFQGQPLLFDGPAAEEESGALQILTPAEIEARREIEHRHLLADDFATLDHWRTLSGRARAVGGSLRMNEGGLHGAVESLGSFRGGLEIEFALYLPGATDSLEVTLGGVTLSNLTDTRNISKWGWHQVRIAYDGRGGVATYVDGAEAPAETRTGLGELSGPVALSNVGLSSALVRHFEVKTLAQEHSLKEEDKQSGLEKIIAAATLEELTAGELVRAREALSDLLVAEARPPATRPGAPREATGAMSGELMPEFRLRQLDEAAEATEIARQEILLADTAAFLAQANIIGPSALRLLA